MVVPVGLSHIKPAARGVASDFLRWLQMATTTPHYHGRYEVIVTKGDVQTMHEVWTKKPEEIPAA